MSRTRPNLFYVGAPGRESNEDIKKLGEMLGTKLIVGESFVMCSTLFFRTTSQCYLRRPFRGTKEPWAENHPRVLYRGGLCLPGGAERLWPSRWCITYLLFWFGLPFLTL